MKNLILIVDDMMLNIDMLTEILKDKYKIMASLGGERAIKLMERRKPDLVLLDVYMPDMDGFSVLSHMKANKGLANIPVIFVTGEHDVQSEEKGLALGAVDYIKKPFNEAVIDVKVRNHLDLKLYRDNLEQLVSERTQQLEASRDAIIMGMSLMSESHDGSTGEHIKRIKTYTQILTDSMLEIYPNKITQELARQIVLYSPLHDVGKVGISDSILKKDGRLSSAEFDTMKSHTIKGAELLRKTEHFLHDNADVSSMKIAIEIAGFHHEKYDGSGYPYGLKGDEIPLSARIVSLTDIYDALRSSRSYKSAICHDRALEIIIAGDGRTKPSHFDPDVLNTFRRVHGKFEKAYDASVFNS